MNYTLTGYLKSKKPILTLGSKGFQKGEIWVEPDGTQYPQTLSLSLMRGSLTLAENVAEGAHVSIVFRIDGRVWQDKCFNELVVLDLYELKDEATETTEQDLDKIFAEVEGTQPEEIPF